MKWTQLNYKNSVNAVGIQNILKTQDDNTIHQFEHNETVIKSNVWTSEVL